MRQATSPTAAPSEAASAPAPAATETVTRPDPGLARGRWEAPAWAFWVALAVVLVAAALYALRRAGVLRLGSRGSEGAAPPSSRASRRPAKP